MGYKTLQKLKTIGIVAHSYEGGALCFTAICREGSRQLGAHMHPTVTLSAIPMGLTMDAWESDDYNAVAPFLMAGIEQVRDGGAEFFICPDNTAHLVLEQIASNFPIPGLHIADVVCHEISRQGFSQVGLLGTNWTMNGPVYEKAMSTMQLQKIIPSSQTQAFINATIFSELCQGVFKKSTIERYKSAIDELKGQGAECVVLGCTEIPLIISGKNSSLPTIDSTRLLAKYAVDLALVNNQLPKTGWIKF